jgi:L-threonylcarbamoyladenylate synthase
MHGMQPLVPTDLLRPTDDALTRAADALRVGRLVAFPTETVYGLGADATNDAAVASIFEAKGRPTFNPLIVHVKNIAEAESYAELGDIGCKLARHFWPGGLTLVAKRRDDCPLSLLVSAGLDTVALRVPAHKEAQALLEAAGRPLAAPSANPSGRLSPTEATHVAEGLGDVESLALILDGGACKLGLESTVIGLPQGGNPTLLRPGAVPREDIEAFLGRALAEPAAQGDTDGRSSPGMLASHYAPQATLRLNAKSAEENELLLGFGPIACDLNLSPEADLKEAAANLFSMLRTLDANARGKSIAVSPIPHEGLGAAINDRLARAAAPRD